MTDLISKNEAYRIRIVKERTDDVEGSAPWTELASVTLALYDNTPSPLTSCPAAKAADMYYAGTLKDLERRTVRGGEGVT